MTAAIQIERNSGSRNGAHGDSNCALSAALTDMGSPSITYPARNSPQPQTTRRSQRIDDRMTLSALGHCVTSFLPRHQLHYLLLGGAGLQACTKDSNDEALALRWLRKYLNG